MIKLGGERRRLSYSWRAAREIEAALELKNLFELWGESGPFSTGEPPSVEIILVLLRAGLMHEETVPTETIAAWLEESKLDMQTVWLAINVALNESTLLPQNAQKAGTEGKKKTSFLGMNFSQRRRCSG